MSKKVLVFSSLVVLLLSVVLTGTALADGGDKRGGYQKDGLDRKIYHKAGFMLMNEKELGLSEEQAARIKEIKYDTKREMAKRDAEIELVKIDIKEKMYQDKIDVKAIQPLIDSKYELKKARAQYLLQQYAAIKGVLTEGQMEELKAIWKAQTCRMK